jgi:hypothetical protein
VTESESPGAVAALGASVVDQLGRQVIRETNRQQQLLQASIRAGDRTAMAGLEGGARWPLAPITGAQARTRTPEQQFADVVAAQEFYRITKFVAACRRQWPGATIVLRPDGASSGARAPIQPEAAHQE